MPAGIAAVVVLGLGLGVRHVTGGSLAKDAGDALYGAFVYYLVLVVRPRLAPWRAGLIAVAACWMIEFAQLTPWPAALSRQSVVFRLALGSSFHFQDLFWYVVGASLPAALTHASLSLARPMRNARTDQAVGPRDPAPGPAIAINDRPLATDKGHS